VKGLELCEQFFLDIAKPVLEKNFPGLRYAAGLIGYGSDVLGFDDEVSTDHMWGPRFYLFLDEAGIALKGRILEAFSENFPYAYKGYSVNFSKADEGGVRCPEFIAEGRVSPLVFVHTVAGYLDEYLGTHRLEGLSAADWLSFSEHRLLTLTSGKLFADQLNLAGALDRLRHYPEDVRLYLVASNWSLIAEEQAFVRRCHDVGDEIGSALVCGRIADRLMRLAFLYCGWYAPYSKWFGKSFGLLPIDQAIRAAILRAVTAAGIRDREDSIVFAQKAMADLHNRLGITDPVDVKIENYYDRAIKVIFAEKIAQAAAKRLAGTPLQDCPLIGALSQVANFVAITEPVRYRERIKHLYEGQDGPPGGGPEGGRPLARGSAGECAHEE